MKTDFDEVNSQVRVRLWSQVWRVAHLIVGFKVSLQVSDHVNDQAQGQWLQVHNQVLQEVWDEN
jgi:hypothetical protein